MKLACVPLLCLGCSFQHGLPGQAVDAAAAPPDRGIDALQFGSGAFGTPQRVSVSSADFRDDDVTLTGDMLEMFFQSNREPTGGDDVYWSHRASLADEWSTPVRVAELSTAAGESSLEISNDGLTMYLSSNRISSSNYDIFVATRPDRDSAWKEPKLVDALSSPQSEWNAQPWSDTVLILGSNRRGDPDVFRSIRTSPEEAWGVPVPIEGLHTAAAEFEAFEDSQGTIWFTGDMAGTVGAYDIWCSTPNRDGGYGKPVRLGELATSSAETDPWLSPDGHTLYFTSDRDGTLDGRLDIYVATR